NGPVEAAVSSEVANLLPAEFVKRHRVLPLELREGTLLIATSSPGNQQVIDDIRLITGMEVEEQEAPAEVVLEKIARVYQVTVEQMIENLPQKSAAAESRNLHD